MTRCKVCGRDVDEVTEIKAEGVIDTQACKRCENRIRKDVIE